MNGLRLAHADPWLELANQSTTGQGKHCAVATQLKLPSQVLHRTVPLGQAAQSPLWQAWLDEHAVPHAPQLPQEVCGSTHTLLHAMSPLGHPHVPPVQVPPIEHARSHPLQLDGSVCSFTHAVTLTGLQAPVQDSTE